MSLRTRLLLALAYVLLLAVFALGVPLALSLRDRVNAEVKSQALNEADVVAASSAELLTPARSADLRTLATSSAASVRGRVIVVDAHGGVLADSAGTSSRGVSYASRPEIATALKGRAVQTQRVSRTLGKDLLATAVPVLRGGAPVGAVRVTQSVAAVRHALNLTVAKVGLVAGAVLMLGLLAGAVIARQIALPLRRLEIAAREIAAGDMSARAVVEGSTEQRSLSRSFNDMAERVERLVTSQREFVANASHYLRTPLTALRLRLEEARATVNAGATASELDAGMQEVDRLAAIVDELLALGRAEARELPAEAVSTADSIRRAQARWEPASTARGISLTVSPRLNGTAWCAGSDLDRVLDALIENALLYSPEDSEVELASGDGRIEIADRGPGLARGEELAVFERFSRGDAGRRGPSGTGLGLPLAKSLTEAWGGRLSLVPRAGGGTVAAVELPSGKGSR
jgi:signal transduction histidine kinase